MDELEELAGVEVASRNRNPNAVTRLARGKETLAPGTFLPRVQALLNPRLYRERGDTNALVGDIFSESGALGRLAAQNPELVTEIRNQANTPMSSGEHEQFRSALLDMVGSEVEREGKIRAQLSDNQSFMDAFAVLDGAIPGINRGGAPTLEESERKQIGLLFDRAQQLALIDPEGSKAIMVEARKKADLLTANVRQFIEKTRLQAKAEDTELYNSSDNALQLLRDASEDLRASLAKDGTAPDFVIQKALTAYGAASAVGAPNLSDAAAAAVSGAASGGVEGAKGGLAGIGIGALVGAAVTGIDEAVNYFKDKKKVAALADALDASMLQVEGNYAANRDKLKQRFAATGIELGEQPGEVYAVVNDAYKAEADKIPEVELDKKGKMTERTAALQVMRRDELENADAEVEKLRPDAAANLPGARQQLMAALSRQQTAQDDLALFEDEMREAQGIEMSSIPGINLDEASEALRRARARRQNRADRETRQAIHSGIAEALKGHMR